MSGSDSRAWTRELGLDLLYDFISISLCILIPSHTSSSLRAVQPSLNKWMNGWIKGGTNQNITWKDHWNTKMYSGTTWRKIFTTGWNSWETRKTQWKERETKTAAESEGIRTWWNQKSLQVLYSISHWVITCGLIISCNRFF